MWRAVPILFLLMVCSIVAAAQRDSLELQLVNNDKISLPPGVTTNLAIRLVNPTKEDELVSLKIQLPKGWKCFSDLKDILALGAQTTMKILSLNIPNYTLAGDYFLEIEVKDKFGKKLNQIKLPLTIESKYALKVELLHGPEYVFAGETFSVQFMVQNLSNSKADIVAILNGVGANEELRITLKPDSNILITKKINTINGILKSVKQNIILTASLANKPDINSSNYYSYSLIPNTNIKFDAYNRFPVQYSSFFISDNPRGIRNSAIIADIAGKGFLDNKNTKALSFHLLGPNRQGQPLYGIYDEYFVKYDSKKAAYLIGDNIYNLSYLTEFSRYARGVSASHTFKHFTVGSFITYPRFFPKIKRESSVYISYSLLNQFSLNLGYLNKLNNYDEINHLTTVSGSGIPVKWANLKWEYAFGSVGSEFRQAFNAEVNINYHWVRLFYNYTFAEKDFPGYFNDTRNIIANANIFLSRKINFGANYIQIHQNMALDTLYGSAPFRRNINFMFNFSIFKTSYFSAGYYILQIQDQLQPVLFNYNQNTIRLNFNKQIKNFGLIFLCEYGKTENLLLPVEKRLNDMYNGRLTLNFKASRKLNLSSYVNYNASKSYNIKEHNNWIYGLSANGSLSKRIGLSFNYQSSYDIEESYNDRSVLDGRLIYSINKNNKIEGFSRYYLKKNVMNIKQLAFGAKYVHIFEVPIRKKKNIGKLTGNIINKGVKTIAGIILSIGSSQAVTDKNGIYSFPMLPAGSYYLMIDYSKAGIFAVPETPGPYKIEILPGIENRFDIGLTQCAKITGEVSIVKEVSDDDKSYAGIREHLGKLLVEAKNGSEVYRNFTKEDGQFAFESLRPGQWSVKVYPAGIPKEYELVTDQFNVNLTSGQSEHIEVKVKEVRRKIKFQTFINTNPPSESQPTKNGNLSGKTGSTNAASKPKPISKSVVKQQGKPIVSDTTRIKKQPIAFTGADPAGSSGEVEYRIQLGAYEQPLASTRKMAENLKITEPIAEAFFKGKYIYTIGSYKTQQEAVKKNREIRKVAGAIGPFVVTFRNGKRTATIEQPQLAVK